MTGSLAVAEVFFHDRSDPRDREPAQAAFRIQTDGQETVPGFCIVSRS